MNYTTDDCPSIPLVPVTKAGLDDFLAEQSKPAVNWVRNSNFKAEPHDFCLVPDEAGNTSMVLFGCDASDNNDSDTALIWAVSSLAKYPHKRGKKSWRDCQRV